MTMTQESKGAPEKLESGMVGELFRQAEREGFDGRMIFRRGPQSCSFFFKEGFIVNAKTNNPEHRLGEVLKSARGLDDSSIGMGLELSRAKELPLGMVLLGEKMIQPQDLYQCLVMQVELIAKSVLDWDTGLCYRHADVDPGQGVVLLRVRPSRILGREQATAGKPAAAPPPEAPPAPPGPPPEAPPAAPLPPRDLPKAARESSHFLAFIDEKEAVTEEDHYGILGLKHDTAPDAVRTAYQRLVREWHPDRAAHILSEAELGRLERVLARVNAAYGILGDKVRRARYDKELKSAVTRPAKDANSPEEDARHLYKAAMALMKEGRFSQAADYFKKAGQLDPSQGKYFYFLGAALFKIKRFKQAEEALLRAMELEGSSPEYCVALGRIYNAGRMFSRARDMFDRALKWDPKYEPALREMREMEKERRKEEAD